MANELETLLVRLSTLCDSLEKHLGPSKPKEQIKVCGDKQQVKTRICEIMKDHQNRITINTLYSLLSKENIPGLNFTNLSIRNNKKTLYRLLVKMTKEGLLEHFRKSKVFYLVEAKKYKVLDPTQDQIRISHKVIKKLIDTKGVCDKDRLVNEWRTACRKDRESLAGGFTPFKGYEHVFIKELNDSCVGPNATLKSTCSMSDTIYYTGINNTWPPNLP